MVDANININLLDKSNEKYSHNIDTDKFHLMNNPIPTRKGYRHQASSITDYFITIKNSGTSRITYVTLTYTLFDHNLLELKITIFNNLE